MSVWTNVLAGIVIPVAIAGTGWYISAQQSKQAKAQQDADRVAILLPSLASQNTQERALAFALVGHYKSKGQLPDEVYPILAQVWRPAERTDERGEPIQVASGRKASEAEVRAASLVPRVYFHIVDERQRSIARRLEDGLEKAGYLVPGIQRVKEGPSTPEIRYFRRQGEEPGEAKKIAERLQALGLKGAAAKYIPGYENVNIRPRHYELWLSPTPG